MWLKGQVKLVVYIVNLVDDSMKLVEPIDKFVNKIMKLSLQICEFILPKGSTVIRCTIKD